MHMTRFRLTLATALIAFAGAALGQAGDSGRGSTPPGSSRDGAAPGDGAITGGSIAPGERSGVPDASNTGKDEALRRCAELEGILREQCLRDAGRAGSGRTAPPGKAPAGGSEIEPRVAPPPQNPR
jgi:hypothetical protein